MNNFIVLGNLIHKPELKELENNHIVCNITVAVNRNYKDKEGKRITDFLKFSLWDNKAEAICKYSNKGSLILLEGYNSVKEIVTKEGKKITVNNPVVEKYRHIIAGKKDFSEEIEENNNDVK